MRNDQRIIFFVFAGREANMEVQRPYINRLLETYPRAEYHVWNLTRNDEDDRYVRGLDDGGQVRVFNHLHDGKNDWPGPCRKKLPRPRWCGCPECRPGQFEEVYDFYVRSPELSGEGTVFVKLDDDIVFIETDRFGEVLDVLDRHPEAVVSANVVNNVVSAMHDPRFRLVAARRFGPTNQREWFDLHADADFARFSHDWFLDAGVSPRTWPATVTRAIPGERISINTIAFTYATLQRINAVIQHPRSRRLGDEGAIVHNFLPRITTTFRTAHLYFGPQRVNMTEAELDDYRARYAALAQEYLR